MHASMNLAADILKHCLLVLNLIAGFGALYFAVIFHKHKQELYFIKRGLILVTIEHIFLIAFLNIGTNFIIAIRYFNYFTQIPVDYVLIVGFLLLNGFIDIIVIRICYYYIQLHRVTTASKQIAIYKPQVRKSLTNNNIKYNPNIKIDHDIQIAATNSNPNPNVNMYKSNTATLTSATNNACNNNNGSVSISRTISAYLNHIGSPGRLAIVFAVIWTIDIVGVSVGATLANDAASLVSFAQIYIIVKAVICVIIIVITASQKTFKFADNWFISKEFIITGKIWIIHGIIAFSSIIISRIVYSHTIFDVVFSYCVILMAFERSYISVKWVIKQNSIANNHNGITRTIVSPRSQLELPNSNNYNVYRRASRSGNVESLESPTASGLDCSFSADIDAELMAQVESESQSQTRSQSQSQSQLETYREVNQQVQSALSVSSTSTFRLPVKSATQQAHEESVVLGLGNELADLPSNSASNSKSKSKSESRLSFLIRKTKKTKNHNKKRKKKKKNRQDSYAANNDQNRQLAHFWDQSRINDENLIQHFRLLWDHCAHELTIENLLFWIETVQLLQVLIEHKYIDIDIHNASDKQHAHALSLIKPLEIHYSTKQLDINDTCIIANLKAKIEKVGLVKKNFEVKTVAHKSHVDDGIAKVNRTSHLDEKDYSLFGDYYSALYKKYFEKGSAPFELNISSRLSNQLNKCYHQICGSGNSTGNANQIVTKEFFEAQVWKNIKKTGLEIYSLLLSSFQRMNIDK